MAGDEAQSEARLVTTADVINKLQILNYESEFCLSVKPPFKPLTSYYFAGPSTIDNPNAQFFYFTSLCAWLMKLCGHQFERPGQFDDPNATATTIIAELKAMGITIPNLGPNRIKSGSGDAVISVLSALADQALEKRGFSFRPIDYSEVETYDELAAVADGDDDANDVDVEDNIVIDSDDEDEVYVRAAGDKDKKDDDDAPITSSINADEWNMEVERVAPLLHVRADYADDWRSRVESATVLMKAVDKMYPDVKQMLTRMADDMEKSRERVEKREQTLAQQFSEQVEEYRVKLRELNTSRDAANVASQSVQQLTMELNQISEMLDDTKREIEDRESKISDTTPLMQVKGAVSNIQTEIKQMALRTGVLQHNVLHYVLKQTRARREGTVEGEDDGDENYRMM